MRSFTLALVIVCTSCARPNSRDYERVARFKAFLDHYPTLATPLTIRKGTIPSVEKVLFDDTAISDTAKNYLYGRIFETEEYYTLLYSLPIDTPTSTPGLVTVDKEGRRIDHLHIVDRIGGEQAQILRDGSIIITDSVHAGEFEGLDSLRVNIIRYEITEFGRFQRLHD